MKETRERGIDLESARRMAKEAQMKAMHVVVADLPDDICHAAATKLGFFQANISPKLASDEVATEIQPVEAEIKGREVPTDEKGKGSPLTSALMMMMMTGVMTSCFMTAFLTK